MLCVSVTRKSGFAKVDTIYFVINNILSCSQYIRTRHNVNHLKLTIDYDHSRQLIIKNISLSTINHEV